RRDELKDAVHLALEGVDATRVLLPGVLAAALDLSPPRRSLFTGIFCVESRTRIEVAAKYERSFLDAGLHPAWIENARALVTELEQVDREHCYLGSHFAGFGFRLECALGLAKQRKKQLYHALLPALNGALAIRFRSAASLGRVHRTKA